VDPLDDVIGESAGVAAVREQIQRLLRHQGGARRAPPVLIIGETGTGKGLVARIIHRAGPRASQPFVDVNCAAIPETLLEAELFGFERGAFTDARQAKPGLFQAAHRGTIFLDEVGLLSEALQAKLLAVIEERAVRRLGSTRNETVDVSIIAATNEDLEAATREQRFRLDLYHRLAVLTLALPPLRDRGNDVLLLAERFLSRICADYGLSSRAFSADAVAALRAYHWPGNIRELNNVVERAVLLSETAVVTAETIGLPGPVAAPPAPTSVVRPPEPVAEGSERDRLLAALEATGWNVSRAAARLGVTRNTIRYRMEKLRVQPRPASAVAAARPADVETPPRAPLAPAPPPAAVAEVTSLRWERRRITFLRADARPRTSDEAPGNLARTIEMFVEKAQAFGGRIEEIGATAALVSFGVEPLEDAPRRAASAALAVEKALERDGGHPERAASIRIGMHVATARVGRVRGLTAIDDQDKTDAAAALGALLTRLEGGGVAVGESAMVFLDRRFDLLPLDPGVPAAWRLAGRERAAPGATARRASFVGRGEELDLLQSRFALASKGDGQVVGIVGEAGIGKSRLVQQFRQRVADQGLTYLEGVCLPHATSVPYTPVLAILQSVCGIVDSDGPRTVAEKVHHALLDAGMEPADHASALLDLFGPPGESERVTPGPEASKGRLFETMRQVVVRASARRPLILVVEDLHWVDRTSEEYLTSLVGTLSRARILVIGTYRPGYRPPWLDKSYAMQVALQPLTPSESLSVVRALLSAEPEPVADPLIQLILAKGEGNPFFLEELTRAVREQGGERVTVPDTLEELLLSRLERLSPDDRRLLQCAAVVGRDVPFSLLLAVAGTVPDFTLAALGRLRGGEFVLETNLIPEPVYTFKHALTQEVAYRTLTDDERRDLHGHVVDAIEAQAPDRRGDHVETLAHHAWHGGRWPAAVRYLRQRAQRAAARWAHREAVTSLEEALAALARMPETREALELAIDLRFDLRNSLWPLGDHARIFEHLQRAATIAEALDDQRRLAWVASFMAQHFRIVGDPDLAIASGRRALAFARALDDFPLHVETNFRLGITYHGLGEYAQAVEVLSRNVELLDGDRVGERFGQPGMPSVISRAYLALSLAEQGEFTQGEARGREAVAIAERFGHLYSLSIALCGLGGVQLHRGDLAGASRTLQHGVDLCRRWDFSVIFPLMASQLGYTYALAGRVADAMPLLHEAASARTASYQAIFQVWLGEAALLAERVDEAQQAAARGLDLARKRRERGHEAWALRLDARLAARAGDLDAAETSYRQALDLGLQSGMRPVQALAHLGLAETFLAAGRRAEARDAAAAALRLAEALGMSFWGTAAEGVRRRAE
jgi:transcriptional regulator with AAA-type ATPase domain/tetratricopeptide (TPR) repeat protein